MGLRFNKHYTVEQARALLPKIREWLASLEHLRARIGKLETRIASLLQQGHDTGGNSVNEWVRCLGDFKGILNEFHSREIQLKDLERGLIDFPSLRGDREIFLCWEKDEEDIEHWHELDTGYAGREPL